jgi:hypothetical protein
LQTIEKREKKMTKLQAKILDEKKRSKKNGKKVDKSAQKAEKKISTKKVQKKAKGSGQVKKVVSRVQANSPARETDAKQQRTARDSLRKLGTIQPFVCALPLFRTFILFIVCRGKRTKKAAYKKNRNDASTKVF